VNSRSDSYYQTILNAIPLAVFVVDEDVRIRSFNDAAAATFGLQESLVLNRRGGEALHCLHAQDVPEGCGRGPSCPDCIIRNAVRETFRGRAVTRRRMKAELQLEGGSKKFELLITASPVPGEESLALLILEDITEISTLRNIIPICAKCKRIRNDQQYWQHVETYFHGHIGVDFTHGICPECMKEIYPTYCP
jgi:PAS domain-containing protein